MTGPTPATTEQVIERVLGEHELVHQSDGDYCEIQWIECSCEGDDWMDPDDQTYMEQQLAHRQHVAAQVAAALRGHRADEDRLSDKVRDLLAEWESALNDIWPATEQGFGADAAAKACLEDLRELLADQPGDTSEGGHA